MKQGKRMAWFLLCLCIAISMVGCKASTSPQPDEAQMRQDVQEYIAERLSPNAEIMQFEIQQTEKAERSLNAACHVTYRDGADEKSGTFFVTYTCNKTKWDLGQCSAEVEDCESDQEIHLTLNLNNAILEVGQTRRLTCVVSGSEADITWSSENPSVVTVEDGVLYAWQVGEAKITAAIGENTATCRVQVKKEEEPMPEDETETEEQAEKETEEYSHGWKFLKTPIEPDYDGRVGPEQPTKVTDGYWYSYSEQAACVNEYIFHEDGTVTARERFYYDDSSGYYEREWIGATYTVNEEKGTVTIGRTEWAIDYQEKKLWCQFMDYWRGFTCTTYMQYYSRIPDKEEMQAGGRAYSEAWNSQDFQKIEDYILPESNSRYLTEADLEPLIHEKLSLARNEIFARHGVQFENNSVSMWFYNRDWYEPTKKWDEFDMSELNQYEYANVYFMLEYEDAHFGKSFFS